MSKANRQKRQQHKSEITMKELYEPLLQAAGHEHAEMFWSIIESEASGVLAWGVRSGYLLWTRTHPGEVPTREQVTAWMQQGSMKQ
jgi:hypothetical protein